MDLIYWISVLFLSDIILGQHIRHERTRYVSGRNQLYASGYNPIGDEANANDLPVVHFWKRPFQTLENSIQATRKPFSRPLFRKLIACSIPSWDLPNPTTNLNPTAFSRRSFLTTEITSIPPEISLLEKSEIHDDVIHDQKPIKRSDSRQKKQMKDISEFRGTYLLLPSKSSKKKLTYSYEKSSKIEEQIPRREINARDTTKKKELKRKSGRRKSQSTTAKIRNETKRNTTIEYLTSWLTTTTTTTTSTTTTAENVSERKKSSKPISKKIGSKIRSPCDLMDPKCEHTCENINGTAVCVCFKGFTPAGTKCVDVDECKANNGGCEGKCVNTIGSRKCICPTGYRFQNVCKDVNECLLRNGHGPCQDKCFNTAGSYRCSCENLPGTKLSSDGHTCEAANQCDPKPHGCSHTCIHFPERTFCICPDGMELGEDWKTCQDVDECSSPEDFSVKCKSECINTVGSYYCSTINQTMDSA